MGEAFVAEIRTVGVCGAGLMGNGIAQTCAAAGFDVVLMEVAEAPLQRGVGASPSRSTSSSRKASSSQADRDATLGAHQARPPTSRDLKDCDLVIEAIVENVEIKTKLFKQLDDLLAPHAIICTNTSSLCVIELAAKTKRPNRVAGLHFFNPVPIMKLVEVVKTIATTQRRDRRALRVCAKARQGTDPRQDTPGFVVNRLLVPYLLYAIRLLRRRPREQRRYRQRHEARLRLPDGTVRTARLRRPRHDVLHRRDHVRRVQGSDDGRAAAAQAHGAGRTSTAARAGRDSTTMHSRRLTKTIVVESRRRRSGSSRSTARRAQRAAHASCWPKLSRALRAARRAIPTFARSSSPARAKRRLPRAPTSANSTRSPDAGSRRRPGAHGPSHYAPDRTPAQTRHHGDQRLRARRRLRAGDGRRHLDRQPRTPSSDSPKSTSG